jgi:hypothetical protein
MTLTTSGRTLPNYLAIPWTFTCTDPYPLEGENPFGLGRTVTLKIRPGKISVSKRVFRQGTGQEFWQGDRASLGTVMN